MNVVATIMLSALSVCMVLLGVGIVVEIIDTVKGWKNYNKERKSKNVQ